MRNFLNESEFLELPQGSGELRLETSFSKERQRERS